MYQCKTCHITTREIKEMEVHMEEHPTGYMLVDAKNVSGNLEEDVKDRTPGSLLGSALFNEETDYLSS